MTKKQLATALRERFAQLRRDFPELIELMNACSDDRVIESHVRCGACKGFHLTVKHAVQRAKDFNELEPYLRWTQRHALTLWPKACLRRIDEIESAIRTERN
jgi:hypothetical protein